MVLPDARCQPSSAVTRFVVADDPRADAALYGWLSERLAAIGAPISSPSSTRCAAVLRGDRLLAVIGYHDYSAELGVVGLSIASDDARWCTRGVLADILGFPFRIGCQRLSVMTREDNRPVIKLLKFLGFVHEGTLRGAFGPGRAGGVWGMLRPEYESFLARVKR